MASPATEPGFRLDRHGDSPVMVTDGITELRNRLN
jgi:serine phosphatase RsbU (regulator of sigma subunit)